MQRTPRASGRNTSNVLSTNNPARLSSPTSAKATAAQNHFSPTARMERLASLQARVSRSNVGAKQAEERSSSADHESSPPSQKGNNLAPAPGDALVNSRRRRESLEGLADELFIDHEKFPNKRALAQAIEAAQKEEQDYQGSDPADGDDDDALSDEDESSLVGLGQEVPETNEADEEDEFEAEQYLDASATVPTPSGDGQTKAIVLAFNPTMRLLRQRTGGWPSRWPKGPEGDWSPVPRASSIPLSTGSP
jgi:hypothetical protein